MIDTFLDATIDLTDYDRIENCITDWKKLARHLKIDPKKLDGEGKRDKKVEMLETWKQREASKATIRALINGLCAIGHNEDACKICKIYNKGKL